MTIRRHIRRTVTVLTAMLIGFGATTGVAFGYTFDRAAAAAYAHKWSSNTETLRNGAYKKYDSDCTNFVSQALRAAGMTDDESGAQQWWYHTNGIFPDSNSNTWSVAQELGYYLVNSGRSPWVNYPDMRARYTPASKGDVYMYEWGDNDGWDHVSLASGYGDFANYYDSGKKKNYRSITGGYGDYMSQHTHDRDYAPWNWGYWTQSDLDVRSKMRTVVIHVA